MLFVIMKSGKFVEDYTNGEKLTSSYDKAEKYNNKKSAITAAQEYGRKNGGGYSVTKIA